MLICRRPISANSSVLNETPGLHLFVINNKAFEAEMKKLQPAYQKKPAMIIWVSWYKTSANIPTDITGDLIRNFALRNGLVDVKVSAVNAVWSGLKLVIPLAKRNKI